MNTVIDPLTGQTLSEAPAFLQSGRAKLERYVIILIVSTIPVLNLLDSDLNEMLTGVENQLALASATRLINSKDIAMVLVKMNSKIGRYLQFYSVSVCECRSQPPVTKFL